MSCWEKKIVQTIPMENTLDENEKQITLSGIRQVSVMKR